MNYSDLLVIETQETVDARLRAAAAVKGAQPDTWKDRGIMAVIVYAVSVVFVLIYDMIRFFAGGAAFTTTSVETLAERWAYSQFGLTRLPAEAAVFSVTVAVEEGQPAADLTTDFRISTSWGQEYFLQTAVVVDSGTSEDLLFQAVVAGIEGNVTPEQLVNIVTPIVGVTITPVVIYSSGVDKETIPALHARCQLTLGGIGAGAQEFVQNLAINTDPLLTKVRTRVDSTAAGEMIVYAGQTAEAANVDQVAALAAAIEALQVFQAVSVTVLAATPEELEISGTVTVYPGRKAEAEEAVSDAIALWQASLSYGDEIPASDIWRKNFGLDAEENAVVGIFSSPAIEKIVDLLPNTVYTGSQWGLTVLVNSLVFFDSAE